MLAEPCKRKNACEGSVSLFALTYSEVEWMNTTPDDGSEFGLVIVRWYADGGFPTGIALNEGGAGSS